MSDNDAQQHHKRTNLRVCGFAVKYHAKGVKSFLFGQAEAAVLTFAKYVYKGCKGVFTECGHEFGFCLKNGGGNIYEVLMKVVVLIVTQKTLLDAVFVDGCFAQRCFISNCLFKS